MPVLTSYTADEFRSAARHFTEETSIEVSGVTLYVWPVKGDRYTDLRFSVGHKHSSQFVLMMSHHGWGAATWEDVRRHLGI